MTCSSCAARIERKLNELDGVAATVNFATERAVIDVSGRDVSVGDLIAAVRASGYAASVSFDPAAQAAELRAYRRRLWVSLALAVPVVALSMIMPLQFGGWAWWALVLATPVVLWGAWPFHRAALANARHRAATMDTLISMGVISAYIWSLYYVIAGGHHREFYFEVAAAVPVFILAGRYFELRAKRRAGAAIEALLDLGAKEVRVVGDDGREQVISIESLTTGMMFAVRPGEKIATDGVVEHGSSAVDNSLVTGESLPVEVGAGDPVIGGSINASGFLVVRATRVGSDTALAQMSRLVAEAQSGKAPIQRLADRVAAVFVPAVIVLALITLALWLALGDSTPDAFRAAVAVLIIACPCALGLATPTALLVGTGRGAQLGILIRGPEILESTRRVDTIVLDKTGTLTTGAMAVTDVVLAGGFTEHEAIRMAGSVEAQSEHPIGRAIVRRAATDAVALTSASGFASAAGAGAQALVDSRLVRVGQPAWFDSLGISLPAELHETLVAAAAHGRTAVAVAVDDAAVAVVVLADTLKPSSRQAVDDLRALGLRPVLLSGDNKLVAQSVADALGIDEVHAEVKPADKVAVIASLQREGRVVAMVGDGVNDAPALAQADLGLSMGAGADAAIEASDLTLVRNDPRAAADAIRLSRRTLRTIKGNLFWAFAYNVAALPLAATGALTPMIAGAAMALSSVFVVSNSLRLKRFR